MRLSPVKQGTAGPRAAWVGDDIVNGTNRKSTIVHAFFILTSRTKTAYQLIKGFLFTFLD